MSHDELHTVNIRTKFQVHTTVRPLACYDGYC